MRPWHRALIGGMLVSMALLVARPAVAQLAYVERDGVLYVSNADPAGARPPVPLAPPTRAAARRAIYSNLIGEIAARYSIPAKLVESLIEVESNFNPRARSVLGARGLMQLTPQMITALGVRNADDARANVEGGVRYLRTLFDRYGGNIPLALAAYKAGPQAVDRYGGIAPLDETQTYVSRILDLFSGAKRLSAADETSVEHAGGLIRYDIPDGTAVYTNLPADRLPRTTRELIRTVGARPQTMW